MKLRWNLLLSYSLILFSFLSLFFVYNRELSPLSLSLPSFMIIAVLGFYFGLPQEKQSAIRDTQLCIFTIALIASAHFIYLAFSPSLNFFLGIPYFHHLSLNSSFNFILIALALYLRSHLDKKTYRILLFQACIFLVAINSLMALTGYALNFSKLYSWQENISSSLSSNLCALILNAMIFTRWKSSIDRETFYTQNPDKEILLTGYFIICILASCAGFVGFYLAWNQYEKAQSELLHNAFSKKVFFLENMSQSLLKTYDNMQNQFENNPNHFDQSNLLNLSLSTDFSAVEFKNEKNILKSLGQWQHTPIFSVTLSKNPDISLNYKDQFYVEMKGTLKNQETFKTQWLLKNLQYLFIDESHFRSWLCKSENGITCLSIDSDDHLLQSNPSWQTFINNHNNDFRIKLNSHHFLQIHAMNSQTFFALEFDNSIWQTHLASTITATIFIFLFFTLLAAFLLYQHVSPLVHAVIREKNNAKQSAKALLESEAKFRQTFDASVSGIALINLEGFLIKANARFNAITEYTTDELSQLSLSTLQSPEDWEEEKCASTELLKNKILFFHKAKNLILKSGQTLWVDYSLTLLRDHQNQPLLFMVQLQDISYQKKSEERLSLRAYFDALTGLANRHHLEQSLEKSISSALNQQQSFAVFFLDLDKFKSINDTLGHEAGDLLLKIVAERLTTHTRSTDIVARLGGDEFIMVLSGLNNQKTTEHFAEKIISHVIAPIHIYGHELFITTSIGISFYPQDGHDAQTLIKNADTALYQAKRLGKNRYCFFNHNKNSEISHVKGGLSLEKNLETAICENQLVLNFQPVKEMVSGKIIQVETLLRSQNEKLSNLSTHSLIHLAVEIGLIEKLSAWILESACSAIQTLRKQHPKFMISVNIAPYYFSHRHFISQIQHCLEKNNLPTNTLILEFRENLLMQNPDVSLSILNTMKELGVLTTLDNFGSGYSSLHLLKKFSLDFIKIDRSILQSPELLNENYLKQFILFLNELHTKVIFEGIEIESHYHFIQKTACYGMQGFFISKPLNLENLQSFLIEHQKEEILVKN